MPVAGGRLLCRRRATATACLALAALAAVLARASGGLEGAAFAAAASRTGDSAPGRVEDEDDHLVRAIGLGYDPQLIEDYFAERPLELAAHAGTVVSTVLSLALGAVAGAALALGQVTLERLSGGSARDGDAVWAQLRTSLAPGVADGLVALGPSYIKFGQSLASRPDLVSAEVASELVRLQDALPPFDLDQALRILERELGTDARDQEAARGLLKSLRGVQPVAAASLGQVYKGAVGGRAVAVKVQRPSVRRAAAADAALLKGLARVLEGVQLPGFLGGDGERLVRADVVGAVDEFCSRLFEEMDYHREASNIERFGELYSEGGEYADKIPAPGVRVPTLYRDLCTRRVLVMEWLEGSRLVLSDPSVEGCLLVDEEDMPLVDIGLSATLVQLLETGVILYYTTLLNSTILYYTL